MSPKYFIYIHITTRQLQKQICISFLPSLLVITEYFVISYISVFVISINIRHSI